VPTLDEMADRAGVSLRDVAVGTTVVAGGVTLGYVAYRVIRFLPSLIPIFWETIPANLAIP
jgi:hypothetical protein